jgi:hypothetical protein
MFINLEGELRGPTFSALRRYIEMHMKDIDALKMMELYDSPLKFYTCPRREIQLFPKNVELHVCTAKRWSLQRELEECGDRRISILFMNYVYFDIPKFESEFFECLKMQKGLVKPDLTFYFTSEDEIPCAKSLFHHDSSVIVMNEDTLDDLDTLSAYLIEQIELMFHEINEKPLQYFT